MKIDLHMHSCFSDGRLSPYELIDLTVKHNYDVISITDHDNIDCYDTAIDYAREKGIELIPGVEISTLYKGGDLHLLAYDFDLKNQEFRDMLRYIHKSRIVRAKEIIEKLSDMGVNITFEQVQTFVGDANVIGRPHIAQALVQSNHCKSFSEAFQLYIGDYAPAYLPKKSVTPKQAIKIIHKAGGLAILAHPFKSGDDSVIEDMINFGVDGLETYYALHNSFQIEYLERYLEKYGLIPTGGTDNHGVPESLKWYGEFSAPDICYTCLKERRGMWKE